MPELNPLPKRQLYQGAYRNELEDPVTLSDEPNSLDGDRVATSKDGPENFEEATFKKRYGDLRRHTNTLTERIQSLETQLLAAQRKEVKIPSTKEELDDFATKFPDVYRHIRSIAMSELLQEREHIAAETAVAQKDLEEIKRERGMQKILSAHADFQEINNSYEFQKWASAQPPEIQDWLFASDNPTLCIKGLDLYKAETNYKKQTAKKATPGADVRIPIKDTPRLGDGEGNKRIWKASEIGLMHSKQYEKFEDEIEQARTEGRIDMNA